MKNQSTNKTKQVKVNYDDDWCLRLRYRQPFYDKHGHYEEFFFHSLPMILCLDRE